MTDLASVRSRGFGARVGFGTSPALLVVDFAVAFTSPDRALGADMGAEIAEANRLIASAHSAGVPTFFSTIAYGDPLRDSGIWGAKIKALHELRLGTSDVEQDRRVNVGASDTIVVKRFASCFFGTKLERDLRVLGIDTLIIAGCTTSGCVRASAVDSCQHGFRTIVAREATADRLADAHAQSLVDIDLKYGDVCSVDEIVAYLDETRFQLRDMATKTQASTRHDGEMAR
jgi:maleamate amidohydrolase